MEPLRKILREQSGVQMWQIEEVRRGQKWPTIYYEVSCAGTAKTFSRPHEAWEYFRTLTDAPDAAPEPPPPMNASK
jgi:hypothetical protein